MGNGKRRQGEPITSADLTHKYSTSISPSRCYKKITKMSKVSSITCRDQSQLLPHRKVFMITEKSTDDLTHHGTQKTQSNSHKRKMILVMDEKPTVTTPDGVTRQLNGAKCSKIENDNGKSINNARTPNPKLFFFANSVDNQLPQKIEEILPEILNRIQWKNGRVVDVNDESATKTNTISPLVKIKQENQRNNNQNSLRSSVLARVSGNHEISLTNEIIEGNETASIKEKHNLLNSKDVMLLKEEYSDYNSNTSNNNNNNNNNNNSNLMLLGAAAAATAAKSNAVNQVVETMKKITLPPKKNLSKFHHQLNGNLCNVHNNNKNEQIISAATPVIVSTTSWNKANHYQNTNNQRNDNQYNQKQNYHHSYIGNSIDLDASPQRIDNDEKNSIVVKQENINLTGDFLFLMKMLPLLEKTPEPRKSHVKMLIEKIMKQCVAGEIMEQN